MAWTSPLMKAVITAMKHCMMGYFLAPAVLGISMTTTHCTYLPGNSACSLNPFELPVCMKTDVNTWPFGSWLVRSLGTPKAYLA